MADRGITAHEATWVGRHPRCRNCSRPFGPHLALDSRCEEWWPDTVTDQEDDRG